jgi:hypothetical protein
MCLYYKLNDIYQHRDPLLAYFIFIQSGFYIFILYVLLEDDSKKVETYWSCNIVIFTHQNTFYQFHALI